MKRTIIGNATVVLPDRLAEGSAVTVEDGKIVRVGASQGAADADEVVDAEGRYLSPGLIDLHIHGSHQFLIDAGPDALADLCRLLPAYGVTGFLPTVCPRPKGQDAEFLASLAGVRSDGAAILGFHLEGPFLVHTGSLPPEAIGMADPDRVRALIKAGEAYPVVFSIAPDFEGIDGLIPIMAEGGTPVFITHTSADVAQTQAAIEAGACHATHLYDVFYAPPETDPGVRPCGAVEAILADPRVSVDFLADGEHVDSTAMKVMLLCKGPDRICLITDANVGAGLPPGTYNFGSNEITFAYEGAPARMTANSALPGALAGSGLTLNRAVANAMEMLGIDLPQAVRMASANPAAVLGLDGRKGQIKPGYDADLTLFDEDLTVRQTWVAGQRRFGE